MTKITSVFVKFSNSVLERRFFGERSYDHILNVRNSQTEGTTFTSRE